MDISLERVNRSPRYPCEPQLAELSREVSNIADVREYRLIFQILYGISYLALEG
jgi:hypothetical protein